MERRKLIEMYFGSKVFGTSVPDSDTDIKFIFQPHADELLLENPAKQIQNKNDSSRKNTKDDIDLEGFSLKNYLYHLASGQTFAIAMLFTPPQFFLCEPDPVFLYLRENKDKLLSKKINSFVGYCRAQFSKYCVKAERLNTVALTVESLSVFKHTPRLKLHEILPLLEKLAEDFPDLITLDLKEKMFECCGRKAPLGLTLERAIELYSRVLESYGARTKAALGQGSIDFKALYHAVRVAREAEEVLLTGHVTYPRPEAELLLKIRKGEIPFAQCSELIEEGLLKVEAAMLKSTLRDKPDYDFINDIVRDENYREIITDFHDKISKEKRNIKRESKVL